MAGFKLSRPTSLTHRSQGWKRLRCLRRHSRRRRKDEVLQKALACRALLWRLPQSCRGAKDILFWKSFLEKIVWRLEEKVQVKVQLTQRIQRPKPCEAPEEQNLVDDVLDEQKLLRDPQEVICVRFNATLTRRDLSYLLPEQWVNDEVMNCYLRMIQEQSDGQLWCPSSFFWPKLELGGHAAVQRWARRAAVNVASCDALVVPLHLEGCHWSLAVVRISLHHILYLDSLGMPAPELLQSRLSEFVSKEDPALSGLWQLYVVNKIPTQLNSSDCGIFVLAYAECVARSLPLRVQIGRAHV